MTATAWGKIIEKAFVGNQRIRGGKPRIHTCDGVANSTLIPMSKVGALAWDYTNSNAYICTVANTTWVKINA
jgi:hypothetical protein